MLTPILPMNAVDRADNAMQPSEPSETIAFQIQQLSIYYRDRPALLDVSLDIPARRLTTLIGPSGCGKTSLLGCLNRINDLTPGIDIQGQIWFRGEPLRQIPEVALRRRVGMVFQRPNPFSKSIYENIALGLRINGYRGNVDDRVEHALQQVGLWDDVKDRLRDNAMRLSGGQQQRLCIARALALGSEVLLMDEPCASLDPISTGRINRLLNELKQHYTIVVVTHNLKQAAVISDHMAYFHLAHHNGQQVGRLMEFGVVPDIFIQPQHQDTWDYVYHQSLSATPGQPEDRRQWSWRSLT